MSYTKLIMIVDKLYIIGQTSRPVKFKINKPIPKNILIKNFEKSRFV